MHPMRNQRGIHVLPLVLIIVVVAALGVAGYAWYYQNRYPELIRIIVFRRGVNVT